MAVVILISIAAVCFWAIAIKCLVGCDWILISGPNMLPKEDRIKFKAQHDMIGLNRYMGKTAFLPAAIIATMGALYYALYTQTDFTWVRSGWFVWPLVIVAIALGVRILVAVPTIMKKM